MISKPGIRFSLELMLKQQAGRLRKTGFNTHQAFVLAWIFSRWA